jgi:hypothetical protein
MIYKAHLMHAVASCSKSLKWRTNILAWMNDVNECHERLMMFGTAKRRKPKNSHRNRGFAVKEIQNLSESVFTRMFRLDRDSFYELDNRHVVYDNNDEDEDTLLRNRAIGDRRNNITERLESEGRLRPLYASSNSRQ